jgi:hypothetical protein
MVNVNAFHTELLQRGKQYTYVKVRRALKGVASSTSEKEKKELLSILEEVYKKTKENILKS